MFYVIRCTIIRKCVGMLHRMWMCFCVLDEFGVAPLSLRSKTLHYWHKIFNVLKTNLKLWKETEWKIGNNRYIKRNTVKNWRKQMEKLQRSGEVAEKVSRKHKSIDIKNSFKNLLYIRMRVTVYILSHSSNTHNSHKTICGTEIIRSNCNFIVNHSSSICYNTFIPNTNEHWAHTTTHTHARRPAHIYAKNINRILFYFPIKSSLCWRSHTASA